MGGMWESSYMGTAAPKVADSSPLPVGPDGGCTPRPPDDNRLSKVDQTRLPGRLTASGPPARHGATAPFRETRSSPSTPSRVVNHQGHHYIASRPQSTSSHLLLYTLSHLSSSPATKAPGQPRTPRRGRCPARRGRARLPQRHDGLARARFPETVPGRRQQCSAGSPRPEAVNHQQLAG